MDTREWIKKYEQEMIAFREDLHRHPELSNKEFRTTEKIREKLEEYGVEIAEIGMPTGVVGLIRGGKPGKTVALREDMDALPMEEDTDLPFRSENPGAMHACGHDIHTTSLLFAARVLSEIREELAGNVLLLFQPGEENMTGAYQLCEHHFEQVSRPDVFVGLHVSPEYDAGCVAMREGPANASIDLFKILVKGKGGHGAHPENFVDPVMISAYLLAAMQTLISRENHPIHQAVLTVGSIHGGTAPNVVPDSVELSGTIRTLDPGSRAVIKSGLERLVKNQCESFRGEGKVTWTGEGLPVLENDRDVIADLRIAAAEVLGEDHIMTIPYPSLGSDDFSVLFPKYAPGVQFRLGSGNNEDPHTRHGIHNRKNVFDERCIAAGTSVLVQYVRNFLK